MVFLSVENIHYQHLGHDSLQLCGASLTLQPDMRLGIMGDNGAGKSTLLDCIMGLKNPQSGQVIFQDQIITTANRASFNQAVGYLFQDPFEQLFCPTVLDDVMFAPLNQGKSPDQARQQALNWLEKLAVAHLAPRDPSTLSGGEARRVALAAILAQDPQILILDEPTAALDAGARKLVTGVLQSLPQAMIIVSHDQDLFDQLTSHAVMLENGVISSVTG